MTEAKQDQLLKDGWDLYDKMKLHGASARELKEQLDYLNNIEHEEVVIMGSESWRQECLNCA